MGANPVLVDSSYYIRLMRDRRDPLQSLALASHNRDIAICGVVRLEVGRAIRALDRLKKFQRAWDIMINVPTDNRLWREAELLAWELDRAGIYLPLPDLVIACSAKRIGAAVLTFDAHFAQIPGLLVIDRPDL